MKKLFKNKNVLVVEDERILREAYVNILSHEGYSATQAINGRDALEKLAQKHFDLILLDILMPEMNGLEFLQKAELTKNYPHTKVIAFSNLSDHHKLEHMLQLGVTQNILKSNLSPKQLAKTVEKLLS